MTALAAASAAAARLAEARSALPPGALDLACHAAVPVAVDPTLLNLLRINFFLDPPDELPWTVEADLLGSPLFRELGGDLYEIEPDLRRHLLVSLGTRYGVERAVQVALLLERYCDRPGVWGGQPLLLHAQQLTALSIIDPPAASRWLDEAGDGTSAPVQLSPDWFVAMRGRLAAQPDPALRVADEIEAALTRLRAGDTGVLPLLGELALLPGADVAPIRVALLDLADDAAAPLLRLLARVEPVDASTAETDRPVPLHLLLDQSLAQPQMMAVPVGIHEGRPLYLALVTDQLVGTVAGSTKHARADMLRSIALAFACTYRPSEVNLVLLDTTGDRVFDDLHVLPHVVAAVTDLSRLEDRRRLHRAIRDRAGSPAPKPKCVTLAIGSDAVKAASLHSHAADDSDEEVTTLAVTLDNPPPLADVLIETRERPMPVQMLPATTAVAYDERRTVADMLIDRVVARHPDRQAPIWVPARANRPTLDELLARLPADGRALGVAGGIDEASHRDHEPFAVDLDAGNVAVVGRTYSGKSTILLSLVLSLAQRRSPDQLEFFIVGPADPLGDLAGLPHVAQYAPRPDADLIARVRRAMQARRLPSGPSTVLVVNDVPDLLPLVEEIRRSGPTSSIRVLVSATSWESLDRFEIELETTLDDPADSRIDPGQYVDTVRSMSHGLAPGGVPFVIPLIDHVERSVSRIAASWTGQTARDRWAGVGAGQQLPLRPVSTGRRFAVVIGTSTYADPGLPPLPGAAADVAAIAEVLRSPSIGNYDVTVLHDSDERTIRRTLDDVLTGCGPDDQVLVYVTGHGMLDPRDRLYLAATDTHRSRLLATAIDAQWIMDLLDHSRARQQVVLIDTCFSGSMTDKRDAAPDGRSALASDVRRAILTATQGTQYAWETVGEDGRPGMSAFTAAVVKGLSTGDADADGDGVITIRDVYEYVYREMARAGIQSKPRFQSSGAGSMTIVRSRTPGDTSAPGDERPGPDEPDAGSARVVVMDLRIAQDDHRTQLEARLQRTFVERIVSEYDIERITGDQGRDLTLRTTAGGAAGLLTALASGLAAANHNAQPGGRLQLHAAMYLTDDALFADRTVLDAPEIRQALRGASAADLAVVVSDALHTAVAGTASGAAWAALRPATLHVGADRSPLLAWMALLGPDVISPEHLDALTGLRNRTWLLEHGAAALATSGPGRAAVMLLDLNGFRFVNDQLGHDNGDKVLRDIAQRLSASISDVEWVMRVGGDEFAVLMTGVPPVAAVQRARELLAVLDRPVQIEGGTCSVIAAAGIAVNGDTADVQELLRRADVALYSAKHRGLDLVLFEPETAGLPTEALLKTVSNEIRTGLGHHLPVWPPGTAMQIGDIGVIEEGGWRRQTSLAELGIGFDSEVGPETTLTYHSHDGAVVDGSLLGRIGAPAVGSGETSFSIQFSRSGALVLHVAAAKPHRITDMAAVEEGMLHAVSNGRSWGARWVVVTEVLVGHPALLVVSASSDAEATVRFRGTAEGQATPAVELNAGLRISSARDLAASFTTVAPVAVLWRGRYLHTPLLGPAKFRAIESIDDVL
ncbi:diguanylate cyclase domain-containing protein [Dactylosporangium sp. NPDC000521]|uniref:caspase, EACC1-associated type n=1 Tax=Dactylosporangium sp. NPDC000521 TaxID=3363975 RepID=UPI00369688FB